MNSQEITMNNEPPNSHLRILSISGAVPRGKAVVTLNLFDEIRAMTWRLLHP
ncbi:MAG: hypothetical protein V2I67_21330 [Thermoanaerobaculales bacterium]|jgi:hypothetical protein|nr:hypothetical protein [Thermoanaerobaculales bacterium]